MAGDDAVAVRLLLGHVEVGAAVGLEAVELDEGVGVEQLLDAVSGGALALGVLALDPRLAATQDRLPVATLEFCEILLDSHELGLSSGGGRLSMAGSRTQGVRRDERYAATPTCRNAAISACGSSGVTRRGSAPRRRTSRLGAFCVAYARKRPSVRDHMRPNVPKNPPTPKSRIVLSTRTAGAASSAAISPSGISSARQA